MPVLEERHAFGRAIGWLREVEEAVGVAGGWREKGKWNQTRGNVVLACRKVKQNPPEMEISGVWRRKVISERTPKTVEQGANGIDTACALWNLQANRQSSGSILQYEQQDT